MKQNIVLLRSCVLLLNGIFLVGAVKAQFLSGYPGSSIPKKTVALGETMYTDSNRAAVVSIGGGGTQINLDANHTYGTFNANDRILLIQMRKSIGPMPKNNKNEDIRLAWQNDGEVLQLTAKGEVDIWQAAVYDLSGRLRLQHPALNRRSDAGLDMKSLSPGVYLLYIQSSHGDRYVKIRKP
jgi:hypothetical protein